jgi:hypothetical protein
MGAPSGFVASGFGAMGWVPLAGGNDLEIELKKMAAIAGIFEGFWGFAERDQRDQRDQKEKGVATEVGRFALWPRLPPPPRLWRTSSSFGPATCQSDGQIRAHAQELIIFPRGRKTDWGKKCSFCKIDFEPFRTRRGLIPRWTLRKTGSK